MTILIIRIPPLKLLLHQLPIQDRMIDSTLTLAVPVLVQALIPAPIPIPAALRRRSPITLLIIRILPLKHLFHPVPIQDPMIDPDLSTAALVRVPVSAPLTAALAPILA